MNKLFLKFILVQISFMNLWGFALYSENKILLTIEADVGGGQEDGDEAGEHLGDRDPRPEDRDGEDDQGWAEVHRVKHCQPHHQAEDRGGSLMVN